jgi:hypothetical protein
MTRSWTCSWTCSTTGGRLARAANPSREPADGAGTVRQRLEPASPVVGPALVAANHRRRVDHHTLAVVSVYGVSVRSLSAGALFTALIYAVARALLGRA